MAALHVDSDIAVIGGGVVGLACSEALARAGLSVLVLERHSRVGQETSSRNSGVVHAGIYYPPGSLKAELCLRGRRLLEERSRAGSFSLRRTGKLIVATEDADLARLDALRENARCSGVELEALDAGQIGRLEPEVFALAGLLSPESGIVDVDAFCATLRRGAEDQGATFALGTTVTRLTRSGDVWDLGTVGKDGSETRAHTRFVVNAAGLTADRIAELAGLDVDALGLRQHLCKGSYFTVAPRLGRTLTRLVYPLPHGSGLGIHLTLDLGGGVRAGPDAEYVREIDYSVDEAKQPAFATAIARYLPRLAPTDLTPAYSGIRPKLAGPGETFRDFAIQGEKEHGLPGFFHLGGMESPGLTASLAIAEYVRALVERAK